MAKPIDIADLPVFGAHNLPSPEFDFQQGAILLVNKPKSWTSFDAVKYLRGRVKCKKVGHAGTLDPMATGLLVICTGKATKSIEQIQNQHKEYRAEITFGNSTPSYDAESEANGEANYEHITLEMIEEKIENEFSGIIQQKPPMYSALKRDGKKLYELARRGEEIELQPRPITIYDTNIHSFESPKLDIDIRCGKGTYIRSIAHDLGKALDSLGYLTALERTFIGDFANANALTPHQYNEILNADG